MNKISKQPSLFDMMASITAKEEGMLQSITTANTEISKWSMKAYETLVEFIANNRSNKFMAEDARRYAEEKGLPIPPSKRAWGAIILKAAKDGLIKKNGHAAVTNVRAHRAFASVWERVEQ